MEPYGGAHTPNLVIMRNDYQFSYFYQIVQTRGADQQFIMKRLIVVLTVITLTVTELVRRDTYWSCFGWGAVMGVSIGVQEQVKWYQDIWCDGEKMAAMASAGKPLDVGQCIATGAVLVMGKGVQYGLGAVAAGHVGKYGWQWLSDRQITGSDAEMKRCIESLTGAPDGVCEVAESYGLDNLRVYDVSANDQGILTTKSVYG